ncbi:hypothetical protein [Glutamicibacter sp. TV12E]|uniref:hypothetical protein n=1 Tax=Glutamicibacter sp. TV12E TaxID=3446362 RepID=UPI0040342B7C
MAFLDLTPEDLIPLDSTLTTAKAEILIADTVARAYGLVPELAEDLTALQASASKAILRKAILRWHQTGSGALVQRSESTGAYSVSETVDTKSSDRAIFTQAELKELRGLFVTAKAFKGKAFSVEMW